MACWLFIVMCLCLVKGVQGDKEALSLDASVEFYVVAVITLIAAVGLWEFAKKVLNKTWSWWNARQRRQMRTERLRTRTHDAVQDELRRRQDELMTAPMTPPTSTNRSRRQDSSVQEELRRREVELTTASMTPPTSTNRMRRQASLSMSRRSTEERTISFDVGVQTDPGVPMIPVNRLSSYTGPFYITTHGDKIHMASYCHGQRNATRASKRYDLCDYCDRARGLYVLVPPIDD